MSDKSKKFANVEVMRGIFVSPDDIDNIKEVKYKWEYKKPSVGNGARYDTVKKESAVKKGNNDEFIFYYPEEAPQQGQAIVLIESAKSIRKESGLENNEKVINRVEYKRDSVKIAKGVILPISVDAAKSYAESGAVRVVL